MGGMLTSMAMRLVQLCYSLMCFLFSFAFVGGGGWGWGWGHGNNLCQVISDTSLRRPCLFCDCLLNLSCRAA